MVITCCVTGCSSRFVKGAGVSFYLFPVDKERRALWIHAVRRKNVESLRHPVVCGKHFQTGKPVKDKKHPDFVPNRFPHNSLHRNQSANNHSDKENEQSNEMALASSSGQSSEANTVLPIIYSNSNRKFIDIKEENERLKRENEDLKKELQEINITNTLDRHYLQNDIAVLEEKLKKGTFASLVLGSVQKLILYTGVPTRDGFYWLLNTTKPFISSSFNIPDEHQLLIVLVKLRKALCDEDLADRFNTSRRTVRRILDAWLPVLASRMKHLIFWPKRKTIKKKLPSSFQKSAYKDTMCIIDCTEIKTERPSNLETRNQMWSNYKQHLTIKFLVAITPQGHISFVSKTWGGRSTDKHISLMGNLTENLKPGDMVLGDRGFNIVSDLALEGIRLIVPAFTRGKKQLSSAEVMRSKRISNVRIHIERVIGYIKRYKILTDKFQITSMKYADSIVQICAAMNNLWPGTVR